MGPDPRFMATHLSVEAEKQADAGCHPQTEQEVADGEQGEGVGVQHRPALHCAGLARPVGAAQTGRASCRERVCESVSVSVGAASLTKKQRQVWLSEAI